LRARHPRADVRNLNPILDEMRSVKSEREIAMIRRASQIAGLGLLEAMRSTEPGVTEYQLDAAARYVFLVNDARLEGYRSITASGTENINNMHYFRNTSTLKDGDLVLMEPTSSWDDGDMVAVWLKDREETTLKKIYFEGERVRLQPANSTMEPIYAKARDVEVQGKVLYRLGKGF